MCCFRVYRIGKSLSQFSQFKHWHYISSTLLLISVPLVCIRLEICCHNFHNFHNSYKIQRYLRENPSRSSNLNILLVSVALKCIELRICCHNIHKSNNFVFIELKICLDKISKSENFSFSFWGHNLLCSSRQCFFSLYRFGNLLAQFSQISETSKFRQSSFLP